MKLAVLYSIFLHVVGLPVCFEVVVAGNLGYILGWGFIAWGVGFLPRGWTYRRC